MIFQRRDLLKKLEDDIVELRLFFADEVTYDSAVFDSRECFQNTIFVAIDGSKSTGIKYLNEAVTNGATCILLNIKYREDIFEIPDINDLAVDFVFVEDSLKAFGKLGALSRDQYTSDVIGVIGSVGKTSTKNMIREIGGGSEITHASRGSFNNETGVPLTLCTMPSKTKRAVVEMGESHFGDIDYIARMARPNILVITNVELAHVEFLGDLKGVAKTMNEAVILLDSSSNIVIPNKTENIEVVLENSKANVIKILDENETQPVGSDELTSFAKIDEVVAREDLTYDFSLKFDDQVIRAHVPLIGRHFVMNAALSIVACYLSGVTLDEIAKNLENVVPQGSRMREIKTDFLTVVDDCYNANPASMKASMKAIKDMSKLSGSRSVFVMGPMRELGKNSAMFHRELGSWASQIGIDVLVCVGKETESVVRESCHENSFYFDTVAGACSEISEIVKNGDIVGVKASRGPDPLEPAMMPVVRVLEELK